MIAKDGTLMGLAYSFSFWLWYWRHVCSSSSVLPARSQTPYQLQLVTLKKGIGVDEEDLHLASSVYVDGDNLPVKITCVAGKKKLT